MILLPCFKRSIYIHIIDALNGLAVGTLFCDSLLHMIPKILNLNEYEALKGEDEKKYVYVPRYIIKMCVAIACLYAFWVVEVIARHVIGLRSNSPGGHGHGHDVYVDLENNSNNSTESQLANEKDRQIEANAKSIFCCSSLKKVKTLGWINDLVADAIHNLADGLAIGASFSTSTTLGVSTTIAVICHEIPHELGNYAVLVKCGFTHCQALLFNLLSASTCLIGFYVGVSVSSNPAVSDWILTVAVGMFLYISLVELMPHLIRDDNWSWIMFLVINFSMFIGFIIMFLLIVFKEQIKLN